MFTTSILNKKIVSAGSSSNILTWQQIMAKEEFPVMSAATRTYFEGRKSLNDRTVKFDDIPNARFYCYDVHDGKMLYQLLQCSQWNRKFHPFPICKCRKGVGVSMNGNHECKLFSDNEYEDLYDRSRRRWELPSTLLPKKYNEDLHRSWCDEHNYGVTHFGIDPLLLPMSTICFDTFHCSCAITRQLMAATRRFLLHNSTPETLKSFTDNVLMKFWNNFLIMRWNNNMNFSCFKGNKLESFVSNSVHVVAFLQDHLFETQALHCLCEALALFPSIKSFMCQTYIDSDSVDSYKLNLLQFQQNVKKFYDVAAKASIIDENEIFYFHCLRYYMPTIAETTFDRHQLGIGIFSMQSFERRNKESKNMLARFSTMNRKCAAFLVNNIKRLAQVFHYNINS
jgi:hypothetical protein